MVPEIELVLGRWSDLEFLEVPCVVGVVKCWEGRWGSGTHHPPLHANSGVATWRPHRYCPAVESGVHTPQAGPVGHPPHDRTFQGAHATAPCLE